MSYSVKIFEYNSAEYKQALQLRNLILREPLGLKFTEAELAKDEHDIHFGLFDGNRLIACLILSDTGNNRMKMRQVAVCNDMQGKGIGRILSNAAESFARSKGYVQIYCHARKTAVPFYQKLGYTITGNEFTEVNIPHYMMQKMLTAN
jgi:predicted GNAT family N-acyltransferase